MRASTSISYTPSNKTATITRGTIAFEHDPEHQRYAKIGPDGVTLYFKAFGVLAERFGQLGGPQRWTNYLIVGGRLVGIHVENADETTLTRYFHTDHLGSIAVISDEAGVVGPGRRLSYDAWGLRREADGTPFPAGPSGPTPAETPYGFTGHEHLDEVGLIHMNGRVYDPLLARFGTPDPVTEDPYSTQGWNRYSYVGNSPVNFTDPSGYCFLGCFWKPAFAAIGKFFRENWGAIVQIAAAALCPPGLGPVCAAVAATVVTGITSGDLGMALRAGATAFFTAVAMHAVGTAFPSGTLGNVAGHAMVGCASAVMGGGRCGAGALSGGITAAAGPMINGSGFSVGSLVANAVIGGVASVAAGGNFANGAVTASFGYLFNHFEHQGKDYVDQFDIGQDAHKTLQNDRRQYPNIFAEQWDDGLGTSFGGRPDLGNSATQELWEIKSHHYVNRGKLAIAYYTLGTDYNAGGLSIFGNATSLTLPGQFATYTYTLAAPGVIVYDYTLKSTSVYQPSYFWFGRRATAKFPQNIPKPQPQPVPVPSFP